MERKWLFAGAVGLPLVLLVAACVIKARLSWQPRLIGTNPDGTCTMIWSRDGNRVQINPDDMRQVLSWGLRTFDAQTLHPVPNEWFSLGPSRFELKANYFYEDDPAKKADALSVCGAGPCVALRGTDGKRFGQVMIDATTLHWNYDDSQFSQDDREVSILSDGALWRWSTQNGLFLGRIPLKVRGVNFSSMSDTFWKRENYWDGGNRLQFFDGKSGRLLWQCSSPASPTFERGKNYVVVVGRNNFEFRDLRTGKVERTVESPAGNAVSLALSPDGSWLWSSHAEGQLWSQRVR